MQHYVIFLKEKYTIILLYINLLFLLQNYASENGLTRWSCVILPHLVRYFHLSTFFWMFIEGKKLVYSILSTIITGLLPICKKYLQHKGLFFRKLEERKKKVKFNELKGNLSNSQQIFHDLAAQSTVSLYSVLLKISRILRE